MEDELIYEQLTKNSNGILSSLEDLNQCGRKLFYIFIHLFLKKGGYCKCGIYTLFFTSTLGTLQLEYQTHKISSVVHPKMIHGWP